MNKSDFIGTWKLVDHGQVVGGNFSRTSDELSGLLTYTDNFMNVLITKKSHPENLKDVSAYSGTYTVLENEIHHHVQVAIRPEMVGGTEVRLFEFSENNLILRTRAKVDGSFYQITWVKI